MWKKSERKSGKKVTGKGWKGGKGDGEECARERE